MEFERKCENFRRDDIENAAQTNGSAPLYYIFFQMILRDKTRDSNELHLRMNSSSLSAKKQVCSRKAGLELVEHLVEEANELVLADLAVGVGVGDLEELGDLLLLAHAVSHAGRERLEALLHLGLELSLLNEAVAVLIDHAEKAGYVSANALTHLSNLVSVHF